MEIGRHCFSATWLSLILLPCLGEGTPEDPWFQLHPLSDDSKIPSLLPSPDTQLPLLTELLFSDGPRGNVDSPTRDLRSVGFS